MNFVHLHTHSHYSLRDAVSKVPDIVNKVKEFGQPAIALTEHGTLSSSIELYTTARDAGIKPIIGVEAYLAPRSRFDKDKDKDRGYYHLILLAMNNTGYQNICKLVTESYYKEAFYHKPRIDKDILAQYSEGIICSSACIGGELSRSILKKINFEYDGEDKASFVNPNVDEVIDYYKKVFGDRFYIEIMRHGIPAEDAVTEYVLENYKKWGVKLIATNDSHYLNPEDRELHELMFAIRDRTTIKDENRYTFSGDGYHLRSTEEMAKLFSDIPSAIDNTLEVADRCNVELQLGKFYFPSFSTIREDDRMFRDMVLSGMKERFGDNIAPKYKERIKEELDTIIKMGFSSYFLVVSDIIEWSKRHGIVVGPGRGSISGSLVAYAMGITEVDPLKYGLIFSRFLNKGRAAEPVVDFDELPYDEFVAKCGKENIVE